MNAFEALVHRLSFNYGLLQVGSTDPVTGAHLPRSSRTDVLLELIATLGPTWDTYQVFHPFINTASGAGWLPTFDARYLVTTLLESPPPDGGSITLNRGWMLQAKAKGSPWPGHARFIAGVDEPTLGRIVDLCQAGVASIPGPVKSGLYPARLSFPPELLPNFRPIARAFLIAIPVSHHRLRTLRDQIALDAIVATIADPSLLPGDWPVEMPNAVASWPGRTNFVGNIDCGLGLYGPSTPTDGEASTNGFYSANLTPNGHAYDTRASDGSGAASNRSVVFEPLELSQPGVSDGAGPPFDYVPSNPGGKPTPPSTYGLRQRGLRLGVRASPSTALHEFGHVFMDALLEWSYLEEADSLTARVVLESRDRKEQVLSSVPLARRVPKEAFFGEFTSYRLAVYSEGQHAIVKKDVAAGHSVLRVLDFAVTSAVIGPGVHEGFSKPIVGSYEDRDVFFHQGRPAWGPSGSGSNFSVSGNIARFERPELRPFFSSPFNEFALMGRSEFLAELYRMYSEARATLWDRVCIGLALESRSLSFTSDCRPDGIKPAHESKPASSGNSFDIRTGGYHGFGAWVSTRGLLELGFRAMNAAFSVTTSSVSSFGADVQGPARASARRDGAWLAAIAKATSGQNEVYRIESAFITRTGRLTNERRTDLHGTPVSLDVLSRPDGGATFLVLMTSGELRRIRVFASSDVGASHDTLTVAPSVSDAAIDMTGVKQAYIIPHIPETGLFGDELVLVRDKHGRVNVLADHKGGWLAAIRNPVSALGRVDAIAVAHTTLRSELETEAAGATGNDLHRLIVALFVHDLGQTFLGQVRCLELPTGAELHQAAAAGGLHNLGDVSAHLSQGTSILWDGPSTPTPHFAVSPIQESAFDGRQLRAVMVFAGRSSISPNVLFINRAEYQLGVGPIHVVGEPMPLANSPLELETVSDIAVGQHSIMILIRRESARGIQSVVREVILSPGERDGAPAGVPWWSQVEKLSCFEERKLLELMRSAENSNTVGPIIDYRQLHIAEHRMFAQGSGGEFGCIARMPTLASPSTSGDSITFLFAVARGGTCQFALSTDGGWRGDAFEKSTPSPDQGIAASDEESIEAFLVDHAESSEMPPWFSSIEGG